MERREGHEPRSTENLERIFRRLFVGLIAAIALVYFLGPAFAGYHIGFNWAMDTQCINRVLQWCKAADTAVSTAPAVAPAATAPTTTPTVAGGQIPYGTGTETVTDVVGNRCPRYDLDLTNLRCSP